MLILYPGITRMPSQDTLQDPGSARTAHARTLPRACLYSHLFPPSQSMSLINHLSPDRTHSLTLSLAEVVSPTHVAMPPCRFVRPDPTHADADMNMYIHTHAHVHIYVHTYTPLRCARRLGSSSITPALPGHEPLEVRESVVRHRVSDDGTAAASTHTCARNKKTPGSSSATNQPTLNPLHGRSALPFSSSSLTLISTFSSFPRGSYSSSCTESRSSAILPTGSTGCM
eukprot:GHVU01010522.1.p1 GENE.GHVU01010522.1~~GHVU01010522.1.p1  ORF type:complete len:228 (-),score=6.67 GHVU01010522.1:24-707(-)